jgi:DNA replication protein DnaC
MPNPTATAAVLVERCQELKLPTVLRELKGAARSAQDGSWSFELFLAELLEREVIQRRANSAKLRIRQARFPDTKTLDQLDYSALQGVSKTKIQALSSGQFIADAEDVIIIGPIGTAKTHLAIGLGVEAARRRKHVAFVRAADLVRQLVEARDDRVLGRLHRRYQRVELLIIDELGFVPLNKTEAELLFNLLADRYERRSTIVTSNLAFGEWVQVFGSEKLTTALLDRLAHHAHVLTTKGGSYRTDKKRRRPQK